MVAGGWQRRGLECLAPYEASADLPKNAAINLVLSKNYVLIVNGYKWKKSTNVTKIDFDEIANEGNKLLTLF